jgi:hypothetical protein
MLLRQIANKKNTWTAYTLGGPIFLYLYLKRHLPVLLALPFV